MVSVHDVAAYLIKHLGAVSTFKLQKLLYYAQAWHLVWEERPLFNSPIEAWANGPVIPEVYQRHRGQFSVDSWNGDTGQLDKGERATVDAVLDTYGRLSGRQLSHLTHREHPWKSAREDLPVTAPSSRRIAPEVMQEYYAALDADQRAVRVDKLDWQRWEGAGVG